MPRAWMYVTDECGRQVAYKRRRQTEIAQDFSLSLGARERSCRAAYTDVRKQG